ncbi:hypothetical protein QUA27_13380 [Microcoleus sp. Pol14C6]|uniref:hypothetical protein n=1 Tax=unclassified Microcoleus TaxID=2642155 RepID=UPI002FD77E17
MQLWRVMQAIDPRNLPSLEQCPNQRQSGVADLWYERLNLQKKKQARQNIFGISNLSIFIP